MLLPLWTFDIWIWIHAHLSLNPLMADLNSAAALSHVFFFFFCSILMETFHSLSHTDTHTQGLWETYLQQDKSKYFPLAGLRNCKGTEDLHGKSHKSLLYRWTCKRGVDSRVPVSIVVCLLSVCHYGAGGDGGCTVPRGPRDFLKGQVLAQARRSPGKP